MQKIENFTMGECSSNQTLTTQGCISTNKLRSCPISSSEGEPGSSDYITYTQYVTQDPKTGEKKEIKCISSLTPEIPTSAKCPIIWGTDAYLVGKNNSESVPQNSCYVNYISSKASCDAEYSLTTKKGVNICTKSNSIDQLPTYEYVCPINSTLDTSTTQTYCLI